MILNVRKRRGNPERGTRENSKVSNNNTLRVCGKPIVPTAIRMTQDTLTPDALVSQALCSTTH